MSQITKQDFGLLMKSNMAIYAKEVNEDRAIPSVIDGLKPVQRRILYWLSQNKGIKDYLGCAQIVGGVLGDFHPRGDSSVYGALVRMSQPLIMSYPLIDFKGNNGSIVDPPAAMRYTKAKLSNYGIALLEDINIPGVISWKKNYLETEDEPNYLLGSLGTLNLLINPQIGIGVGLASNFTCHNIEDIKSLVEYRMAHPNCSFEDLPPIYPSFHNNGILINKEDIPNIYKTGKGSIILRAKYKWEDDCLIITEFPYRVDPSQIKKYLIQHPMDAIKEIYEQGGQLRIYTAPRIDKDKLLENLFKKTNLQMTYQVNMTATGLNGKPKVFTLLDILDIHIALQHSRFTKKALYYKEQAEYKLHIDEGIVKALDIIDEVIELIRSSDSPAAAKVSLMNTLNIDVNQAQAILDIKLAKLARMEIDSIRKQIESYREEIAYQQSIIDDKDLRQTLHLAELATYSDKIGHTECLDLVKVGNDGNKVNDDFYYCATDKIITISANENENMTEVSKDDELILITNKFRGIKRKATELSYGETSFEDIVKLNKDEKIIYYGWASSIADGTFTAIVNGSELHFSTDVLTMGSTSRGKKLMTGKDLIVSEIKFG